MSLFVTTRRALPSVLTALLLTVFCLSASAQQHRSGSPGSNPSHTAPPYTTVPHFVAPGPHLLQWMDRHSNLTPEQQQKALEREPGFQALPPETQQRMHERLSQLNSMPPERRRRWLERNEAIAQLSPSQRQQVRDAMHQFGALPPDRKHQIAQAFKELRDVPEQQRQSMLNSDRYRSQFSDQELGALSGLLSIEPYHVIMPRQQPGGSPE